MDGFKQICLVMLISINITGDPALSLFEEYIFGVVLLNVCVTESREKRSVAL